jgi:UDP-N-acetylmuramoyl-L-alanyl-D-glutamate--2,6-diaminopimelate ligase
MRARGEIRSFEKAIAFAGKVDEWRIWQLSRVLTKLRSRVACISKRHPARWLNVIGVTGTDGKTTTVEFTAAVLAASGRRVSWISTIGASVGGFKMAPFCHLTTPGPFVIQTLLHWMKRWKSEWVVLEASSHGLAQSRLAGIPFRVAVLTNITPEHLDYHGDMEAYRAAKGILFRGTVAGGAGSATLVLNRDDPSYSSFAAVGGRHVSYGLDAAADVKASSIHLATEGSGFDVTAQGKRARVAISLPGLFNVYNALAALAVGDSQGLDLAAMAQAVGSVRWVTGRMSPVSEGQSYSVVIDFAHTPSALERVLRFYAVRTAGRIILVFGCAGERDTEKRTAMGEIAGRLAWRTVVTREDNRSESIEAINDAIAEGLQRMGRRENIEYVILPDRRQAIQHACNLAVPGDLVLITGKGHERSLNIDGCETSWDEYAAAREAILKSM